MYLFFIIAVTCALFLNTSLSTHFGFEKVITISFFPIIAFIAIRPFFQKIRFSFSSNREAVYMIVLAIVMLAFKFSLEQDYIKKILFFLIVPALISVSFENLSRRYILSLRTLVIVFFMAECVIAILERIYQTNFFHVDSGVELSSVVWEFRSTSLLGHPLANALFVAVFMSFVVTADIHTGVRIGLFGLGYIALFCFNARGATLVMTFLGIPYLFWKTKKLFRNRQWLLYLGAIGILGGLYYLLTETSLGGRILNAKLMDGSAQTRLNVFKFHTFLNDPNDLLWGNPDSYLYVAGRLEAGGVENGIITMILDYGIIFTPILLLLLFRFQFRKLSGCAKWDKWFLLAIFYIIAVMNPNLSSPIQWILWLFTYYAFKEKIFMTTSPVKINM